MSESAGFTSARQNQLQPMQPGSLVHRGIQLADETLARPGRARILVVEDVPDTRALLKSYITNDPDLVVVGEAANGAEALELYRQLKPDVVSMNCCMPLMDGISASRAICSEGDGARIVVVSVQGDPDVIRKGMDAGVSEWLLKPLTEDEYVTALKALAKQPPRKPVEREDDPLAALAYKILEMEDELMAGPVLYDMPDGWLRWSEDQLHEYQRLQRVASDNAQAQKMKARDEVIAEFYRLADQDPTHEWAIRGKEWWPRR